MHATFKLCYFSRSRIRQRSTEIRQLDSAPKLPHCYNRWRQLCYSRAVILVPSLIDLTEGSIYHGLSFKDLSHALRLDVIVAGCVLIH